MCVEIIDSDEIDNGQHIRTYRTPSDGFLKAYRSDDEQHHIVISRGKDARDQWEKEVPATINRPIPGQHLWTIPDNWEHRVTSNQDSIAYGLYHIPETHLWVQASIPTNDWLSDAFHAIKAVGHLAINPVGTLGTPSEVRQLADEYEAKYDVDHAEEDANALRELADNWEVIEEQLERATDYVYDDMFSEPPEHPSDTIRTDRTWEIEYQTQIFDVQDAIKNAIDTDQYDIPLSVLDDELRDAELIPSQYKFKLTFEDSPEVDMQYYIRGLIEAGATPPEALDYYMTKIEDLSQTEWAGERGISQASVSGNVKKALNKLHK